MAEHPHTKRFYRGEAYWEKETPREVQAGRWRLRYFGQARKLQVLELWVDRQGELRPARSVTLDIEVLGQSEEARALLRDVLNQLV